MGKQSAPATPDYTPIAQSSVQAAQIDAQSQANQLAWAKQEFAQQQAIAQPVIAADVAQQTAQTQIAQNQENTYNSTYLPIEQQFAQTAQNFNSADQSNQAAGAAMAGVASQFDASRSSALSSLESYGIDPSQTRFQALDTGSRVQQAAATAAAGTQSRLNTQAQGLSLESAAINTGRGYASAIDNSYSGALGAGSGAISGSNSTGMTGASELTSGEGFGSLANNANNTGISALNTGFQNGLAGAQLNNSNSQALIGNITSLAGGALGFI